MGSVGWGNYHQPMTITAAVDGSALGNPGPAGWAWVVSEDAWAAGGFDRATNNVGELTALLKLLEHTAEAGFADESLVVLADSQYVINSVTKWMPGWKRKGWKKADGKPVMNRELMERIDRAMVGRQVKFEWVKGHAGHDMNEAADLRARAAAEAHKNRRVAPSGPAFTQTIGSRTAVAEVLGSSGKSQFPEGTQDWASWREEKAEASAPALRAAGPDLVDPLVVVAATELATRLNEVLDAASLEPVTVTRAGKSPLLLMDADTAWRALALLDEEEPADGMLF